MLRIAMPVALAVGLAAPAAQPADILGACEADIAAYCADVTPGAGRIAACLYAHEDKVSVACDAATGDTADVIDQLFERLRVVRTACGDDIRSHCAGVEMGQGRILSCLTERRETLSESCVALVDGIELPRED